ncbi:hypothetical protein K501DRAFT_251550 [Backusella circina FSU 941]|nr:hypothetical protein K501DRAFT_264853 [Backusella circina FSU 941]KAI8882428.1 hypothetical protein K501DRAFT_251550 [Backusella circina FSU 941]
MGEDKCIPPSPPSTTTNIQQNHKKHVRHHVKRRSSGRVHVAKLAPMIRANAQTDPETDQEDAGHRPTIRRSQSQRSLHRASFDRKGMTGFTQRRKSTASERPADTVSPPSTPPQVMTSSPARSTASASINPAHLTHQAVAAPVEQTLTAVANNLIIPDKRAVYPLMATSPLKSSTSVRKQPLKSQFVPSSFDDTCIVVENNNNKQNEWSRPAIHRSNTISRTQQKLLLQRQQAQVEDETSPIHPRNMQKLNKELELVGKEYRCVKRYQDPMRESLVRHIYLILNNDRRHISIII